MKTFSNDIAASQAQQVFKITTVGASGSGKTCFSIRVGDDTFSSCIASTIGVDFVRLPRPSNFGESVLLYLADTGHVRSRACVCRKSSP
jgi:GTPase SAR1 family protein